MSSASPRASERPAPHDAGMDPVASLFSADRTLPAPVVAPEVNESEMTRWKSARSSLFGESVKDPPPPARGRSEAEPSEPLRGARAANVNAREGGAGAPVRSLAVARIGQLPENAPTRNEERREAREGSAREGAGRNEALELNPEPLHAVPRDAGRARARMAAPSAALAPPVALGARPDATPTTGKPRLEGVKRAKADAPPAEGGRERARKRPPRAESAAVEKPEAPRAPRRIRRGPRPWMLATLGAAVLLAGGAAAVFLGVVPSPLSEPASPARGVATANRGARPKMPATPKTAASAPLAATPTTAVASADAKPAVAAAPAKVAAAPAKAAAAPAKVAAAPAKAAAAPAKAAAAPAKAAAAPAKAAAAPVASSAPAAPRATSPAAEPADEGASAGADNEALIALARKALADENATSAEALAKRALGKDPSDHHAMEVLARALIDLDRGPEAVSFARRIVEKRKKRVPYRLLLGDALLMVGDAAGARKEWQAALEIEPGNREVKQRLQ